MTPFPIWNPQRQYCFESDCTFTNTILWFELRNFSLQYCQKSPLTQFIVNTLRELSSQNVIRNVNLLILFTADTQLNSEQEAALDCTVQPCWTPGGRHSVREDKNDQPPLHRNSRPSANSCRGCPGAATKRGNHKNIATPWQCCSRQSKGDNSVSGGRKVTSPAPPPLQPWRSALWLWAVFHCENWPCWKEGLANSRPCKSGELTTSCHTPFGVPYHLPEMVKATATLCGQQQRVLGKSLNSSLL